MATESKVGVKAVVHFTGWINRADGTREMIFGEADELTEQQCIDAGIPKRKEQEKTNGSDS